MIQKLLSVYVLAHSGFAIRCFPMADSQLILDLLLLRIRGGCSLAVLLFFLMLVGTCCFKPGFHITFQCRRPTGNPPATHRRHRRKVETCSTFFLCGASDLQKFMRKHDCGRSPVGRRRFQKFNFQFKKKLFIQGYNSVS